MSYDITFKVKVEGVEKYVPVGDCDANVTWNVGEIIRRSTGIPWHNCENNGYCKDIIPCIARGLKEVSSHPEKYKPYEAENGWGTVESVIRFFTSILEAWDSFCKWETEELVAVTTFWIE